MKKVRVPLYGSPQKAVTITADATEGATVGVNVYNRDGTLFVPSAGGEPGLAGDVAKTVWRYVLEVPDNVRGVEKLDSYGFVRRGAAGWSASQIVNADLSGADTTGLAEGLNLYFTDERARTATVADQIDAGVDNVAPSQRAVAAALESVVGQPGPPGKDGQIRFTGNGPPGVLVGAEPGDTYMDLSTGTVYKLS